MAKGESNEHPRDIRRIETAIDVEKPTTENKILWLIGELGGGTEVFSEKNMIGLYRLLKESTGKKNEPDYIIFNGELLAELPEYTTKRGRDKQLFLAQMTNELDEMVVGMKPHLSRIADTIKDHSRKGTEMIYAMGPSDEENIKNSFHLLAQLYGYGHDQTPIRQRRLSYEEKIKKANEEIIENTKLFKNQEKKELKELKKEGTSKEKMAVQRGKANRTNEKIKQLVDETADYTKLVGLYYKLQKLWIKEHPEITSEDIKERWDNIKDFDVGAKIRFYREIDEMVLEIRSGKGLKEIQEEYQHVKENTKKIIEELNETKRELMQSRKSESLIKRQGELEREFEAQKLLSKELANKIKKYSYKNIEETKKKAEKEMHSSLREAELYTNNLYGSPTLARLANDIAKYEILIYIKNAFGRRMPVRIIEDHVGELMLDGVSVLVTNRPSNTSSNFTKDNDLVMKRLARMEQTAKSGSAPLQIILGAHSPIGRVSSIPKHNGSDEVIEIIYAPPFVDRNKLAAAFSKKIKTKYTEMYSKYGSSSGFFVIKVSENGSKDVTSTHTFYTSEYLEVKANQELARRKEQLIERLQGFEKKDIDKQEIDSRDEIQIKNKFPSYKEMNDILLNKFMVKNDLTPAKLISHLKNPDTLENMPYKDNMLVFNAAPIKNEAKSLTFIMLADSHIGSAGMFGISSQGMISALPKYLEDRGVLSRDFVLVAVGDNIDANYKNFSKETNNESPRAMVGQFKDFLLSKKEAPKENTKEFDELVQSYRDYRSDKQAIHSLSEQFDLFNEVTEPFYKAPGFKAAVYVSGNHGNKAFPDRSFDEASFLLSYGKWIAGKDKAENLVSASGGDFGHRSIIIKDLPVWVSHKAPYSSVQKLALSEPLVLAGDIHQHTMTIIDNKVVITGASSSLTNSYPEEVFIPVSKTSRGFTKADVLYNDKGILSVESHQITYKELEDKNYIKVNPYIKEFESKPKSINIESKKIIRV